MSEFTDFEVQLDLTDVNPWAGDSGTPAPAGDWQMKITNVEHKPSKSSNRPMLAVTFEIVAGADGSDAGEATGLKAYTNYVLDNSGGQGRVKQLMIACGASLDKIRGSELLGQTIKATVTHASVQGVGADGNPLPPKTFANVMNEQPLEMAPAATTAPAASSAKTPPIMNKAPAATKTPNGARRA